MLNKLLWTSFVKELNLSDIEQIEGRIDFLRDILEDAIAQFDAEDVSGDVDLNLHIYINYFEASGATKLTPWIIHDAWFSYYDSGVGCNSILLEELKVIFTLPEDDLRANLAGFLRCARLDALIIAEADAVIWLSFLDHMAAKIIFSIGKRRINRIFFQ